MTDVLLAWPPCEEVMPQFIAVMMTPARP